MSKSKAAFHRKILPWIFIIVFIVVAPSVVFYTSGYRWNTKKSKIERLGTVIIDSYPIGAEISIDSRPTDYVSPITLQNMTPGKYKFTLHKDDYHTWEKNLEIIPEKVTFMNFINLWKKSEPILVETRASSTISISPDDRYTIIIEKDGANKIHIIDELTSKSFTKEITEKLPTDPVITWSKNSRHAIITNTQIHNENWLIDAKDPGSINKLPSGVYRWMESELIGVSLNGLITIQLPNISITKSSLVNGIIDTSDIAELRTATGTEDLIYVIKNKPQQGFILPSGDWRFWHYDKQNIILRDGSKFLAMTSRDVPNNYHEAKGQIIKSFTANNITKYLLINDSELWIWDPQKEPELTYRQSQKIINAYWHKNGRDIFFATSNGLYALNLDPRDGYLKTELATFDEIFDFSVRQLDFIISGVKNGQTGQWTLGFER